MTKTDNHVAPLQELSQAEQTLRTAVGFARRYGVIIGTVAIALGCAVALATRYLTPRDWEASAVLAVVPPTFTSQLMPSTLTVQAYQRILESDAVLAETRSRLIASDHLDTGDSLRLGKELSTRIFVSRRSEETTLAPMLEVIARARTPERAAAIANTWASVFLERTRNLVAGTTSSTVDFIESQYPASRERLQQLEAERNTMADAGQATINAAEARWQRQIKDYKNETETLLAAHRAETERRVKEYTSEHDLETRRAQLDALRETYTDFQREQARVSSALKERQLEFEATQRQLEKTDEFITTRKAISDDALWGRVADAPKYAPDWSGLQDRVLVSQEANPVYFNLLQRVTDIQTQVNVLTPRSEQLSTELSLMSDRMRLLDTTLLLAEAGLEELVQSRDAELLNLKTDGTTEVAILERERDRDLGDKRRRRDTQIAQLDRDIDQQTDLFSELATNFNQALLAKAQQTMESIRLGAPAVAPAIPEPDHALLKGVLTTALVLIVAFLMLLIRSALVAGHILEI